VGVAAAAGSPGGTETSHIAIGCITSPAVTMMPVSAREVLVFVAARERLRGGDSRASQRDLLAL
jgi:hypothetical protein